MARNTRAATRQRVTGRERPQAPVTVPRDAMNDQNSDKGQSDRPGESERDQDRHEPAIPAVAQEQQGGAEQEQGKALGVGDLHRRCGHVGAGQQDSGRRGEAPRARVDQAEHDDHGAGAQQETYRGGDQREAGSGDAHDGTDDEWVEGVETPLALQNVPAGVSR